jgi:hypothetical protein
MREEAPKRSNWQQKSLCFWHFPVSFKRVVLTLLQKWHATISSFQDTPLMNYSPRRSP